MSEAVFLALIGVGTSILGYWYGKRKSNAEAKGIEVSNDKEILNTYKTELEYFSKQLEDCRKEISDLREEIKKLLDTNCSKADCPNRQK